MILTGLPWKQTEIILLFLRLHPSTAFWTLVDYDGHSISSKGFLPTVVDVMLISVKFAHSSPPTYYLEKEYFFLTLMSLLIHGTSPARPPQESKTFQQNVFTPNILNGKARKVKVSQSCLTLHDPMSPPGSSLHRFSRQKY